MRTQLLFILAGALAACGESKQEPTAETPAALLTVDLAAQDIPFMLDLGDPTTLGVDTPQVRWNEELGRVEVSAGDHFALIITEEEGDIARVKADLDRDMLQKHTVIEEAPEQLTFRSQFPDETLTFIHFYRVVHAGGRHFVVQDDPAGRFNEADIARMARAARTDQPV